MTVRTPTAAATRSFAVEVLGTCPGTDVFTGTTLDRTVWPTITREDAANYKVENGVLRINAVAGDMWTGTMTAKNVISRPAPAGLWTATTKVSMAQVANGEQAAVILSQGDTEFYKAAFIRTAEGRNVEFVGLRVRCGRVRRALGVLPGRRRQHRLPAHAERRHDAHRLVLA